MTHPPMTLARFLRLVEAYGSELSRFPAAERESAEALLRSSEPARAALAAESELDRELEAFAAPELSPSLARRLNEIPIRTPAAGRSRWPFRRLWAPALGWAAAAALGVVLGGSTFAESDDALSDSSDAAAEASAEQSASDEALAELALGSFADLEEIP